MSNDQNKQIRSILSGINTPKSLILSYIFLSLLLSGCGETKTEPQRSNETSTKTTAAVSDEQNDDDPKTILFFGDSITAGFGLDDTENAFPGVIQEKIDSLEMKYKVINSGVSGETTAGGKSRIKWVMNQAVDVFVLELGANDGLRGVPIEETRSNLQAIIDTVRQKSPDTQIVLAGMQLPPNMGQDYTQGFKQVFYDIAEKNDIALIPFILKDVGGVPELNQKDGIHPTIEGHEIVASNVWEVLKPVLD
ncbi:MAG: arylesterase [Nonlabens sp.]